MSLVFRADLQLMLTTAECPTCGATNFIQATTRQTLQESHDWFFCLHCGKSMHYPAPKKQETVMYEPPIYDHKCPTCEREFSTLSGLRRHVTIAHSAKEQAS